MVKIAQGNMWHLSVESRVGAGEAGGRALPVLAPKERSGASRPRRVARERSGSSAVLVDAGALCRGPRRLSARSTWRRLACGAALLGLGACNVEPIAIEAVGPGAPDAPDGACGRGLVVVRSDYQSSAVSLVGLDGGVQRDPLVSSASSTTGLSAPFTGDLAVPTTATPDELVFIDRYPASVLTWFDARAERVRAQLAVGTGFAANPHDYLALSPNLAFVTRFETNHDAGREPLDAGGDLLVLDPSRPAIVGAVDLKPAFAGERPEFEPHPDAMVRAGQDALVLLAGYSADFQSSAASRLVRVSPEAKLVDTLVLDGLHGCSGLALSPSGDEVAVVCAGLFDSSTATVPEGAGLAFVSLTGKLREVARVRAEDVAEGPLAFSVQYVAPRRLLVVALGALGDLGETTRSDAVVLVDASGSRPTAERVVTGEPFTLGSVRCAPACGACFVADAEHGAVLRLPLVDGQLGEVSRVPLGAGDGLPPRTLGGY